MKLVDIPIWSLAVVAETAFCSVTPAGWLAACDVADATGADAAIDELYVGRKNGGGGMCQSTAHMLLHSLVLLHQLAACRPESQHQLM